jgi:hypothetical protein
MVDVTPDAVVEDHPAVDRAVRCAACRHELTDQRLARAVAGSHEHTFRNPAGYSFHVRCFSDAPGCGTAGDPTDAATWFPGFAWSFATCAGCGRHVGWWYVGAGSFIALIAPRLA